MTTTLGACVLALGLAACDGGSGDGSSSETGSTTASETGEPDPIPTGATCDPANTLTYENFGEEFFDNYCLACHKSTIPEGMRFDAPIDVDYETKELIQMRKMEIDEWAGAAGDIVNELMPPIDAVGASKPTLSERENLAAWLACGAP